jgi:hypothetical protein
MLLLSPIRLMAADYHFAPSLTVSEEYTDNVFESHLNKRSDYITRLMPGLVVKYSAPLWDWDLAYNLDYRYYARESVKDDTTHNIDAKGLLKVVNEVLFLEVNDSYKRVPLNRANDTTKESLFFNQSDQNIATVSPYLILHPSANMTLKSGYRYINTWYKSPQAISKQDHVAFIDDSYEVAPKLSLTAGYSFTREEATTKGLNRHETYLGPRYEYADKSFIFVQGGAIITDHDNNRSRRVIPTWKAGITHSFDTMTASLSTEVKYTEDPLSTATIGTSYAANLAKNLNRGIMSLQASYTEYSDAISDVLKNKQYSTGFKYQHEIFHSLQGSLSLTYEYYTTESLAAYTRKYFMDSNLTYVIGKDFTIGITYRFIDYTSPKILTDNKQVNLVILEAKKIF